MRPRVPGEGNCQGTGGIAMTVGAVWCQIMFMAADAGSGGGVRNTVILGGYRWAGTNSRVMAADADVCGNGSGVGTGIGTNVTF